MSTHLFHPARTPFNVCVRACLAASLLATMTVGAQAAPQPPTDELRRLFVSPPKAARPWVYWFVMDGNLTREGIHADLEAMQKAGIGGVIYMEVGIGIPRGPVAFMSPQWKALFAYAVSEARRLGLQISLSTGPGWAGTGGPWVKPELSMQHLVASETTVVGPTHFDAVLPRPRPRTPAYGEGTLTPQARQDWQNFYRDEVVLAVPTPDAEARLDNVDQKALYYRPNYTASASTPPRLPAPPSSASVVARETIAAKQVVVLTDNLDAQGRLQWEVPPGRWTILRFGHTATGQMTRPAPDPGLGFESDKLSATALDAHLDAFTGAILKQLAPNEVGGQSGLTMLHFDSWEMGSQNWSPAFRQEFTKRRGYDPLPFLPAMLGYIVESPERSERFLWDLRQTIGDLIVEKHGLRLRQYAHEHGLTFSGETYDQNPAGDLELGSTLDLPMGEFWSQGYGPSTEYSCFEAVSIGHTNGLKTIGAEAFTAQGNDAWLQYPGSMKAQLDWALCNGINKFVIHRYQHQPELDTFPGMTMGPYGVHWERTQTWWDMVPAFHTYIARTSAMLRQGLPVADILYLTPEGAPQVFTPPSSALTSGLPDRKGYNFDGCAPKTLIARAAVKNGDIFFPDGMTYRVLVLPDWDTMTPTLLRKITQLVESGATVVGRPPLRSPSLTHYPAADAQVKALALHLWGRAPFAAQRQVGRGRIIFSTAGQSVPVKNANWIWFPEGNPALAVPPAACYFRTSFAVETGHVVKAARISLTADNAFELFVNGVRAGSGDNFHDLPTFDITRFLKRGNNEIRVRAVNQSDAPNPAGVIGSLQLSFQDGGTQVVDTGRAWSAAQNADGPWSPALEIGPMSMAPWYLAQSTEIYPFYSTTARWLTANRVAPDFAASQPMRFIHRHLPQADVYFVANARRPSRRTPPSASRDASRSGGTR